MQCLATEELLPDIVITCFFHALLFITFLRALFLFAQICKKRGPLGACLETVVRTDDNDNDKARKYFADPKTLIRKELTGPEESEISGEGSALIEKLRQQTKDNFEKNELEIQRRTFENGQVCHLSCLQFEVSY
jgi:hypothetical protein